MDPVQVASIVIGVLAVIAGLLGLRRGARPASVPRPELPPPPKGTAQEHENAHAKDTAEAVADAADAHGVDAGVVADDLAWADAVRESE